MAIDGPQNQLQGSYLGSFCSSCAIQDGDPFLAVPVPRRSFVILDEDEDPVYLDCTNPGGPTPTGIFIAHDTYRTPRVTLTDRIRFRIDALDRGLWRVGPGGGWVVDPTRAHVSARVEHVFVSSVPPVPAPRASILHADLDAFYASVEQRDSPRLRGRPVAVGGGVVLAASYEAKRCGVATAMGARQARALCPELIVVGPRFDAYVAASHAVFDLFHRITPVVQGISIDEAFLDVGGLHRIDAAPVEIARRLRAQVRDEVGLPITVGVARTPFLAKVASRVAKPDGLLLVDPRDEDAFLHPLPVERLWGVGDVTAAKLHSYGLRTAGDVAALPRPVLVGALGPAAGGHLFAVVHGGTPERVVVGHGRGSVGAQRALGHGPHRPDEVRAALLGLVDRAGRRMRKGHHAARTVVLRLRFDDYGRATRSRTLAHPTTSGELLAATAVELLDAVGPLVRERGLTLVGVALTQLSPDSYVQGTLDLEPDRSGLHVALDAVAARFGTDSVTRAALLRTGTGWAAPVIDA